MARSWLEMRRLIGPQRKGEFLPSQRQVLHTAANPDITEAELAALVETEEHRTTRVAAERLQSGNVNNASYSPTDHYDSDPSP